MTLPLLSLIVLSPLAGAAVIALLPADRHRAIKWVALVAAAVSLALSVWVYLAYDRQAAGFQFVEQVQWIPTLGMSYHLGVDGLSVPMLLLTGVIIFCGVLISWTREHRPKEFFALLLTLTTGVFGVFAALDLFLLFVFYELAVLPMYVLIAVWGTTRKEYAAMKLTLYLLVGTAFSLAGGVALYFAAQAGSFDIPTLMAAAYPADFQRFWFPLIFIGFSVLAGLWPFHTWSPDGHVAAPTAVSMLHAGVLMKLGAYAALRVGVQFLPQGAAEWLPWIVLLTLVNVVYGASVALVQNDFKYVIGYSSVSHMGLVTMGVASMTLAGLTGAVYQMFSHGIMTGLFFAVVGLVYRRTHTREILQLGGLVQRLPLVAIAFIIGGFASMGMPGTSGFVAEFQVLVGVWQRYPIIAVLSGLGIVITAAYVMRVVYRVFFGELRPEFRTLPDVARHEGLAIGLLAGLLVFFGLLPGDLIDLIHSGVEPVLEQLAAAGV